MMFFTTNAEGEATFFSPEWTRMTGRGAADALRLGWIGQAHPDDREPVRSVLLHAIRAKTPFSIRHRLGDADGGYTWVAAIAVPSFKRSDGAFTGFLCSCIADEEGDGARLILRADETPRVPDGPAGTVLELIADHLLIAHSLIAADGHKNLLGPVELALYLIGHKLAASGAGTGKTRLQ